MRRTFAWTVAVALAVASSATEARAACSSSSCTITSGLEYCCDQIYTGTGTKTYTYSTMAGCDNVGTPANPNTPDGTCVVCLTNSGGATVNGGSIDEIICGSSGNDTIDGRGGNDWIEGRDGDDVLSGGNGNDNIQGQGGNDTMMGGDGNDSIVDTSGNTFIDGGDGNDFIVTVGTDDEIYGGSGNDSIYNHDGADYVDGGSGDDLLQSVLFPGTFAAQDIGSTYCGGTGDDTITTSGGGHTCIDAGEEPGDADSCSYTYYVNRTQTSLDVATQTGCETTSGITSTRTPFCGCN